MPDNLTLETPDIEALIDGKDRQRLRLILNEMHPADLAEGLSEMDKERRLFCFRLLDLDNASAVLSELESDAQVELLRELGDVGVVSIISHMPPDDAADVLSELPKDKARSIIGQLTDPETVEDLEELMSFKEDTAGGIMSTDFLAVKATMTVDGALTSLRQAYEKFEEDVYDIYVVDDDDRLAGKLTIKELLTAPAEAKVESIMETNVIKVSTATDQEEAADKLGRYDLLSLPVVDDQDKLRGIITADDIIDVIQEEATEDIYQSSGISTGGAEAGETLTYSVPLAFQARLPWLLVTVIIEALSAVVINRFDSVIRQTVAAAAFMPLLSAVTGSVAVQSTCIVIRSASTGHISWRTAWKSLRHEIKVGVLLGLFCGIATTIVSFLFNTHGYFLGLIVGLSLFVTMMLGICMGTLAPIIFERAGIDPAHASGPFITSLLDVCTFTIYLAIVHMFLAQIA